MLTLKAKPWYPGDVPGDCPYLLVTEVSHVQHIMLIDNDSPGKDAACQFIAGRLDLVDSVSKTAIPFYRGMSDAMRSAGVQSSSSS